MAHRLALWVGLGAAMAAVALVAVLALPGVPEHADAHAPGSAVGSAAGSAAGSQAAPPVSEAARLVADAQAEVAAGRLLPAHGLYERAYALDPSASTLLELAVLEHRMGRCREARQTAGRVLAASPDRAVADR